MNKDLLYQLALSQVPQIGHIHAKILAMHFGSATAIFKAKKSELEKIEGIGSVRASSIKSFNEFNNLESEIKFIEKFKIQTFFITDAQYPQRLHNCNDAPALLFYKGKAGLNNQKIIAIVGTRTNTTYGKQFTEKLVAELSGMEVMVISGLAFGIDAIAHRSSIKNNLPTVGVVAHGFKFIYPPAHKNLAAEMLKNDGGILTEFKSDVKPDKHNFPGRNRIVAGISDVTIVVETDIKGGSMITADIANSYNRDVCAVPGKTTDSKSCGCNYLIKSNKAVLLTDAKQLIELMGWEEKSKQVKKSQRQLFTDLTENEKLIVELLSDRHSVHIDELNLKTGLSNSTIAAAILQLELQNIIQCMPGKMYRLN